MKPNFSHSLFLLVGTCIACGGIAHAGNRKPESAFLTTFVTACRLEDMPRETKYASDLNTLSGLRNSSVLAYVFKIGSNGPLSQQIGGKTIYYDAFNLYLVNKIVDARSPTKVQSSKRPANSQSESYTSSDGNLFTIEWRASVTFDEDSGQGGYLEGQGGVLSDAEYRDIITYLQAQPFHLVVEWRSILSGYRQLPVCDIKWTATDRYMSSQR